MTRCTFSVINLRQDWDQYVDLRQHSDSIQEIMFWKQNIHCLKPVSLLRNNSEFNVFTDASDIGAGGYLQGTDYIAHRQWSVTEATKSSTWREIKAIELTLDSFAKVLEHSSVTFFTDNQNAVSIIKKGSKLPHLQGLALSIFNTCVSCNISLYAQWIPREENEKADALSRIIDIDDWGISFEFFDFLNSIWGPFTVDRFANMHNTKLTRFNSKYWNPTTSAIDAFTCNWHGENNWLVPPISLVSNCINHLVSCGAEGTLVVPKWQSAAFWPLIFKQNSEYACYVVDVLEFHEAERIFVAGNNLNSLFANDQFHGKILATIFSVGFWSQNEQIKHPELKSLFNSLSSTILDARAKSTVEKYAGYFKRFVKWTEKYSEIKCVLPCQELYVGLYLQNLIQSANHYSVIESAFYGIKWAHNLAGVANPCDSEMVRLIVEASRRKLNRPIEKKSPVTSEIMIKLFSKYNSIGRSLKDLRLFTMCALSYTGFLRYQ
ncbi:Hypothetical predicted protein [Mytilus galloprovincialis]|uniref:Reverse transcriptase RNase H-like domain-containing protein n=1 Tax=Mytilus galloprovincialis TaxID=29158 RepID=A0A8B6GYG6_MYTGA|nr:Hypothetical predicted protein [Mytilus galloprovincialis]